MIRKSGDGGDFAVEVMLKGLLEGIQELDDLSAIEIIG